MSFGWDILFDDKFVEELLRFDSAVRVELLAHAQLLEQFGPELGRPYVDTFKGSRFVNMKELRFNAAHGVWRAAFAFDPKRRAVILTAAAKTGVSQRRFYRQMISTADRRFETHLARLNEEGGGS